jgi:hypothetical protein
VYRARLSRPRRSIAVDADGVTLLVEARHEPVDEFLLVGCECSVHDLIVT